MTGPDLYAWGPDDDRPPPDTATLRDVRRWARRRTAEGKAVCCPVCTQNVKVYRRKLNSGMARALLVLYRAAGTGWAHKPTVLRGVGSAARDESLLRYWGLLEEDVTPREDGGRPGHWRVTRRGEAFALGEIRVPSHAVVFDARLLRLDGDLIGIRDALGDRFDYDELMSQRFPPAAGCF